MTNETMRARFREHVLANMPVDHGVNVKFADGTVMRGMFSGRTQAFAKIHVEVHGSWLNVGDATWEVLDRAVTGGGFVHA